jgi:WhiB family transcriptional regulator, redox-sensing transcriptional regulator
VHESKGAQMVHEPMEDAVEGEVGHWRARAACRPYGSELFFPVKADFRNSEIARAKAICRQCPVREECLQVAMDGREKIGIWGGFTPEERARLHRLRRRARAAR